MNSISLYKNNLDPDFYSAIIELDRTFGDRLTDLNGLSDRYLNFTNFINNFIDETNVADASIDSSSNVTHSDIVTFENEMIKPITKLFGLNKIYYEIKKEYGKDVADDWIYYEWVGAYYLHDAHNATLKPYCYAYSLEKLVYSGLYFLNYSDKKDFNSQSPKHLETFVDFVCEFISWNCNRTSGAVGIPEFLVYAYYFWKNDKKTGYYIKNPEYYRDQEFQRFIYKLNQPWVRSGIQSAFINVTIFDESYIYQLFGGKKYPDGTYIINYVDEIIEFQKRFLEIRSEIHTENMMTFPVLTYALLAVDEEFESPDDFEFVNEDFAKWCVRHNMYWNDCNFFISKDVTTLSNCCRLLSNVKDIGYFNSIGGTALEVGSVKVSTINLAHIAYYTMGLCEDAVTGDPRDFRKRYYIHTLRHYIRVDLIALDRVRHIIERNVEKGLLPNYSNHSIDISKQYNTVGIIGMYETLKTLGYTEIDEFGYTKYTSEGIDFAKRILEVIHEEIDFFKKEHDIKYFINIEQIPGERAASILQEKDLTYFKDTSAEEYVNTDLPLYGNQWIPLGIKCTLKDKIDISATLDKACSGGSVAHINLEAPINEENFDTAWNLIKYIAWRGVNYFAFNVRINACKNNHGFFGDECPFCESPPVTTYQRIVGFLTREDKWSKVRRKEFKMRDWFKTEI